ncbi:hypothetical protein AAF712_008266 [Marasmius tenuissimus]|uniref:DUF659 domain-containing protein n=1 Tax=Marasmius tenuissimus TaxID=585030 RepID=A0ABR2ZTT3_9AGAR
MDVSTSSGLLSSGLATSPPSTIGPGDSVSQVGSITGSPSTGEIPSPGEPPAKRSRKSSTRSAATQSTPQQWNDTLQNKFETQIAQITASQGLPLSWVENPEWENFLWEFLPGAHNLSQGRLTWIIIPRTLAVMQGVARGPLQGSMGTLQADGWSGINSVHTFTVRVHDASLEQKTADNLLLLRKDVIQTVQSDWKVEIIAFTTDASGEARKAHHLLAQEYPHIVTPDCFAHQVNLIVGDYFKVNKGFLQYSKDTTELIGWLQSKTYVLALIRQIQITNGGPFLAGHDIMRRNNPAQCQLVTGNKKAQEMAWEMIDIIQDSKFWAAITCIKSHLEPLAIAANITQAATCWLDQVMFTLGFLYYKFLQFTDPQDGAIRQVVLGSISEHWNKCDWQDVGLGCAILNPFVSLSSFHHIEQLSKNGILQLMQRLWTQFYNSNAPQELLTNINDYFDRKGSFIAVESVAVMHLNLAANEARTRIFLC